MKQLTWKSYVSIAGDALTVFIAFYFGRWIGFALAVFCIGSLYALRMEAIQETTRNVLLSRLPDRCAMCHREILDEPGVLEHDFFDELKTYHESCGEKLDAMKEKDQTFRQRHER
jgi:hypothetical protein